MRRVRILTGLLAAGLALATSVAGNSAASPRAASTWAQQSAANAAADDAALQAAATDLTVQALAVGALPAAPAYTSAAKRIYADVVALTALARSQDPSLGPQDTTAVMGPVPAGLTLDRSGQPPHRPISVTHSLQLFDGQTVPAQPSPGYGLHDTHFGNRPARFRHPNGVTVEPVVPALPNATVGDTAVRAALQRLGLPYVWAAGGPVTFDCSGLTQWAYAHAGIALGHYTGWQWNQGRLIPPADILPGDLILFGDPTHHVGMYLGAGWMINAPYTGQYVDVVPIPTGVAGVIRP